MILRSRIASFDSSGELLDRLRLWRMQTDAGRKMLLKCDETADYRGKTKRSQWLIPNQGECICDRSWKVDEEEGIWRRDSCRDSSKIGRLAREDIECFSTPYSWMFIRLESGHEDHSWLNGLGGGKEGETRARAMIRPKKEEGKECVREKKISERSPLAREETLTLRLAVHPP